MDVLSGLNEKQREAVTATEGYVRVIAGAGSGKTKLLVSRYAYLVKEYGIDPANILCVTFTNKAAGEMKKRIRTLIGQEYDTTLICTYHGFCARVLREDPEKLFLSREFTIIDPTEQKTLLSDIYQKYELKLDHASFERMLNKIGRFKGDPNNGYVSRMCDPGKRQIMPSVRDLDDRIIEEYLQRQKAIYALDFDDLMYYTLHLLQSDADVRGKWQTRLNYIQVDEFQDSSRDEMQLIDILSDKYRNLMIVGDPDQNIYEWRGSDVGLLVDFDKTHEPTETIYLNRNYRSTPQILQCANTLIDKNEFRLKKELFTLTPPGADVIHIHSKNDFDETRELTERIRELIKREGLRYSDFAVLYRAGFLSRVVEKRLVEENIPYEIYGGVKFYQRMEVRDAVAYLRLVAFDDDEAFKRIINTPRRKFGRVKMAALTALREETAEAAGASDPDIIPLYSVLKANLDFPAFRGSGAAGFVEFIENMRREKDVIPLNDLVRYVTERSGYEKYIRELGDEERLDNLTEFKRMADEFERGFGEQVTLSEFLRQVALQSAEHGDKPVDAVKLMTIHSSKGLEFPAVFVLGFTEGIFPSSKSVEQRKKPGLEEERRLCYVAMTRAQRHLYLMDSEGVSQGGMKKLPSRFLSEIGKENYTRIGVITEELERESREYSAKLDGTSLELTASIDTFSLNIGDKVIHHAFGQGIIVGTDDRFGSLIVRFDKLSQPRNISREYFMKEHKLPDIGTSVEKDKEEKTEGDPFGKDDGGPQPAPAPSEEENILKKLFTVNTPITRERKPRRESVPRNRLETIRRIDDFIRMIDGEPGNGIYEKDGEAASEGGVSRGVPAKISKSLTPPPASEAPHASAPGDLHEAADESLSCDGPALNDSAANLWEREDLPHSGWICTGISDLGMPAGICGMCGKQIIRYVHHMIHPDHPREVGAGCVCAGKMEGDPDAARRRELDLKNREARRESFKKRKWRTSGKGNRFIKINNHVLVLYKNPGSGRWSFAVDGVFSNNDYYSEDEMLNAAFDEIDGLKR